MGADGAVERAAADDAELIGRAVGAYRLVRLLGRGGMGAVYLGEHPSIGSKVAIKLLHPHHAADRQLVERFFNEARAVNLIGHDNIVKVLDYDVTSDGRYYCVMELLTGRPLAALLRPGRALPLRIAGPIFLQCCRALQAAHEHGIVHRDLKPDNVYLVRQGERDHFVKVLDFGIAKLTSAASGPTTIPGVVIGTPAYMSPEQAAGDIHRVGPASDVYSLGVMMFEVATGRTPFVGRAGSLASLLMAHLHEEPPRLQSIEAGVPEEYERIVLRCLSKEPSARWQSMAQLHEALSACLRERSVTADLPRVADVAGLDAESRDEGPAGEGRFTEEVPAVVAPAIGLRRPAKQTLKDDRSPPPSSVVAAPRWTARILLGSGALAVLAAAWFVLQRPGPAAPSAQAAPPSAAVVTPAIKSEPPVAAAPPPKEAAPAPRPARKEPRQAAVKPAEPAQAPQAAPQIENVRLLLVSTPRASVDATWPGGSAHAETPGAVHVPRYARVRLVFSAPGYAQHVEEVEATLSRAVTATLKAGE